MAVDDADETAELISSSVARAVTEYASEPSALPAALDAMGMWTLPRPQLRLASRRVFEAEAALGIVGSVLDASVGRLVLGDRWDDTSSVLVHPVLPSTTSAIKQSTLHIRGLVLGGNRRSDVHAIPCSIGGHQCIALLPSDRMATLRPAGLAIAGSAVAVVDSTIPLAEAEIFETIEDATAEVQLAAATYLTTISRSLLDMARSYVEDRQQFGQPLAVFQAVKHHLAHVRVHTDAAGAVLDEVWNASTTNPRAALVAKALAATAFAEAHHRCMQVMGGMGYSLEHPAASRHRLGLALARLGGTGPDCYSAIGRMTAVSPRTRFVDG